MVSIMYFTATWCGPCRAFGPIVNEVQNELGVNVQKVDIDQNQNLAMEYHISSVPCLVFLKDGMPIHRHVGVCSKSQLIQKINMFV